MNDYETYHYRGCKIRVVQDEDPSSPREWDNLGTMVCWHGRYNLGDERPSEDAGVYLTNLATQACRKFSKLNDDYEQAEHDLCSDDLKFKRIEERWGRARAKVLETCYTKLPLYLYDHSGITMSTGKFSCAWDSGQVGFIYVSLADVLKEHSLAKGTWKTRVKKHEGGTESLRDYASRVMTGEVSTYDDFITGSVYGYIAEAPGGEQIDSCWGYYGYDETKDDSYMVKDCAKPSIDAYIEEHGPILEPNARVWVTSGAVNGIGTLLEVTEDGEYEIRMDAGDELFECERDEVQLLTDYEKNKFSNTAPFPEMASLLA